MKPTLLVLAAGMGSRYGGVKQIDGVGLHDECLLDFAAYDAKLCGYSNVVFIIRRDIEKDFRERLFDRIATARRLPAGQLVVHDFGATPGVARLRIEQVLEEADYE